MKTLIVVGHPDLSRSFVNKAWVDALRPHENESLKIHILHEVVRADGSFDLSAEQALLDEYDRIVLQYPLYWYMVPSIMKEWMDTVWADGWCYGEGGNHMEGKLLEAAVSCGAPDFCFDPNHPAGTSLEVYNAWLQGSAGFVRGKAGRTFAYYGAESPDTHERIGANIEAYIDFVLNPTHL